MNPCMIASILIATVVVLRIAFIIAEIENYDSSDDMTLDDKTSFKEKEMENMLSDDNIDNIDNIDEIVSKPITKQLLRGMQTNVLAYERFKKIYTRVIFTATIGGHNYKLNLCYKNAEITKTIETMVRESFPDSTIKSLKNGTCTAYKISW